MACVVLHHGIAMGLHVILYSPGNVQKRVAGPHLGQTTHQGFLGHTAQPLGHVTGGAHCNGDAAIPVKAFKTCSGIHLQQIPIPNHTFTAGNAMDHFIVDAGADGGGETLVALEAGNGTHVPNALFRMGVQISGGLSWFHQRHDFFQDCGHDPAGLSHFGKLLG